MHRHGREALLEETTNGRSRGTPRNEPPARLNCQAKVQPPLDHARSPCQITDYIAEANGISIPTPIHEITMCK